MTTKKCKKGYILREGYVRKGHVRKGSTKGKRKGSYVDKTKVPPSCVPDKGKKGKTKKKDKILPKLDEKVSLSAFGYSIHKSDASRQLALRKASDAPKSNPLKVLRRLNLIRNYQADENAKKIMSEDVEYMKEQYAKFKENHRM